MACLASSVGPQREEHVVTGWAQTTAVAVNRTSDQQGGGESVLQSLRFCGIARGPEFWRQQRLCLKHIVDCDV